MSLIVMSIKLMSWIGRSIEVVTVIYIFVRSFKLWSSVFASYIKPITISVRTQTTTRGEAGVSQLIQESITSTVTRHVKYCELNVWNKICNVRTRSLNVQTSSKQHDLWFLRLSGKKMYLKGLKGLHNNSISDWIRFNFVRGFFKFQTLINSVLWKLIKFLISESTCLIRVKTPIRMLRTDPRPQK